MSFINYRAAWGMNTIVITQENEALRNPLVSEIFRLRHEAFINRLKWDIASENGMERDQFDDLGPYHIAMTAESGSVDGCWRALPTTGDYMLKDIFPELLQGEQAPQADDIWEISRFAVRKGSSGISHGYINSNTVALVRSFNEFAQKKSIRGYVTVTTIACERLLRQLGVSLRRLGEGKSLKVGNKRSVALWIKVDEGLTFHAH